MTQKAGTPTVTVVTEQFVSLAKAAARGFGYPDLPMVVVPHPFETLSIETVEQLAHEKAAEIAAGLVQEQKAAIPAE